MEKVTTAGKVLRAMKRIEARVEWYKTHHKPQDDMMAAEMAVFIPGSGEDVMEAIYSAYRFGFSRGYNAAKRDLTKKGVVK